MKSVDFMFAEIHFYGKENQGFQQISAISPKEKKNMISQTDLLSYKTLQFLQCNSPKKRFTLSETHPSQDFLKVSSCLFLQW